MTDYRQVPNTSFLDNSTLNGSFISNIPNDINESRVDSEASYAYTPAHYRHSPNVSPYQVQSSSFKPSNNTNPHINNLKRDATGHPSAFNQNRLDILASRRRSTATPTNQHRPSIKKPISIDAKKKENTREKQISAGKRSLKIIDCLAAFIAISSGIIVYNENEVFLQQITRSDGSIEKRRNESNSLCTTLRFINMFLTIGLCILVILHYYYKLKLLRIQKPRQLEINFKTAGLLTTFIIELLICAIFCPPFVDYSFSGEVLNGTFVYSFDAITNIVTLAKSYLILKLYVHFSPWTSERASIICSKYKCQASVRFAIKAELKKRPYLMLGILMGVTLLYLGFAIRTFEQPYRDADGSEPSFSYGYLVNDFWIIISTMTTVGFGEGYPQTHLGRIIGVISCLIGMLLLSLMVVSLTVASEFTPEESKAFYILKRVYANDNAKEKAANVMKTIFRLRKTLKSKNSKRIAEKFVLLTKLKKQISIFKNDYRIANSQNISADEMLLNLQEKLETDIHDIKKEVMMIPELDNRCNKLKERQGEIYTRLDEILKIQGSIAEYMIQLKDATNQK